MGAHAVSDVSEDLGPVLELNPIDAVGKRLDHDPLHERGALGHDRRLYQTVRMSQLKALRAGRDQDGANRRASPTDCSPALAPIGRGDWLSVRLDPFL